MKSLLFVLVFSLIGFSALSAQTDSSNSFKLTDISVGSGEGALSSGIAGSATVTNGKSSLIFQVCSNYVQMMYGTQVGDFFLAGSGGYFNNTPWIGPFVVYKPANWITLTTWEGVCAGKDKHPDFKVNFNFAYQNVCIKVWMLYFQYSLLHFQEEVPNNIPGAGITVPLDGLNLSLGCDYTLRDHKPLFSGSLFIPIK